MRDDPKPKGSVHAPVALGPLPLTDAPEFFHLLRRALAEHVGREPEHGQTALGCGLAPALLVLFCVGMLADGVVPPVHEVGELAQVLVYKGCVRPQVVEGPLTVPRGGQLVLRLGPALVKLAQVRSSAREGRTLSFIAARAASTHSVGTPASDTGIATHSSRLLGVMWMALSPSGVRSQRVRLYQAIP